MKSTPYRPGPMSRKVQMESTSSESEAPVEKNKKKRSDLTSTRMPKSKVNQKKPEKRKAPATSSSESDVEKEKDLKSKKQPEKSSKRQAQLESSSGTEEEEIRSKSRTEKRPKLSRILFENHVRRNSPEIPATKSAKSVPTSTQKYRDIAATIKDFSPDIEVTEWTSVFKRSTRRLSEVDKLDLFHAKITPKCFAWFSSLDNDGTERTSENWLREMEQKYKRNPTELRQLITSRKQQENEDPEEFVADIQRRCYRYHPLMLESEIVAFITENVNEKYSKKFIDLNLHSTTVPMTLRSLKATMEQIDGSKKTSESSPKSAPLSIFYGEQDRQRSPTRSTECQLCRKRGHSASSCWSRNRRSEERNDDRNDDRKRKPSLECQLCGKAGHAAATCWSFLGRKDGRQDDRQRGRNEFRQGDRQREQGTKRVQFAENSSDKIRCYNCNQQGHISRNCRTPRQGSSPNTRFGNNAGNRSGNRARNRTPSPSASGNGN